MKKVVAIKEKKIQQIYQNSHFGKSELLRFCLKLSVIDTKNY